MHCIKSRAQQSAEQRRRRRRAHPSLFRHVRVFATHLFLWFNDHELSGLHVIRLFYNIEPVSKPEPVYVCLLLFIQLCCFQLSSISLHLLHSNIMRIERFNQHNSKIYPHRLQTNRFGHVNFNSNMNYTSTTEIDTEWTCFRDFVIGSDQFQLYLM